MDKKARIGMSVAVIATIFAMVMMVISVVADVPVWSYVSLEEQLALEQQAGNAPGDFLKTFACQMAGDVLIPRTITTSVQTQAFIGECNPNPPKSEQLDVSNNCVKKVLNQVRATVKTNCEAVVIDDPKGTKCTVTPRSMNNKVTTECVNTGYEHQYTCTHTMTQGCGHVSYCNKDANDFEKACLIANCQFVPVGQLAACKAQCQKDSDEAFKACTGPF